jgi:murein L,D-transpeptidase YafK
MGIGVLALGVILVTAASSLSRNARRRSPNTVRIEVTKKDRKLIVYSGRKAIRTYRIGLGANPTGPKTKEGDGRTPEGDYYICSKNPHSRFYRSLALSYPNVKDAERGLQERRITQAQYNRIARAIQRKRKPPWDTPLSRF